MNNVKRFQYASFLSGVFNSLASKFLAILAAFQCPLKSNFMKDLAFTVVLLRVIILIECYPVSGSGSELFTF